MIHKPLITALLCFVSLFAYSQKKHSSSIFSIGGKPVSIDEFVYLYKKNNQNQPGEFTQEKIDEYLNLYINFKLKVSEAQLRGMDTTQAFKKEYNGYREELRKPYLPDAKILDSLVRLTYQRMQYEVSASHILVNLPADPTPKDTLEAYNKITQLRGRTSAEDFNFLAENFSDDPSAKFNRGNLGYFTAMQMVYPFESAAYTTSVGSVSNPVRTRFGYHLVKVNDRRPARGEVEVSHIMIRTGENKDNDQAKNAIFDVYDELQKGVSWNDLCKQYSEDPATKDNGGKLRPFGVGAMAQVPPFEDIAFGLEKPGDYSDPFQTQYGWHIVKLERKIPMLSYEEMVPTLKARVSRDERVQASRQSLYNKMKKDYGFTEDRSVKEKLMQHIDTTLTKGKWKFSGPETMLNEAIVSVGDKKATVRDLADHIRKNQRPINLSPGKYFEQLYSSFVDAQLVAAFEEKIIAQSPDYKWLLREYYEGILLFEIMEDEVWNKASADSIGQRRHFESNASKYKAAERIDAVVYSSTTKEHIDELAVPLRANDSLAVNRIVNDRKIRKETGAFEKSERAIFGKIQWQEGIQLTANNQTHYLVQVKKILPPGLKTFAEARSEVITDYQNFLEQQWLASLRKKHPVKINKKGRQQAIRLLTDGKVAQTNKS